jgi:hypothetical protein
MKTRNAKRSVNSEIEGRQVNVCGQGQDAVGLAVKRIGPLDGREMFGEVDKDCWTQIGDAASAVVARMKLKNV